MNIRQFLRVRNITFKAEDALIISKATLNFNLRTIHFSSASTDQKPECYLIKIDITFDNSRHSGQVFVRLNTVISYINLCNGRILKGWLPKIIYDSFLNQCLDFSWSLLDGFDPHFNNWYCCFNSVLGFLITMRSSVNQRVPPSTWNSAIFCTNSWNWTSVVRSMGIFESVVCHDRHQRLIHYPRNRC